jgi:hypothetical protein
MKASHHLSISAACGTLVACALILLVQPQPPPARPSQLSREPGRTALTSVRVAVDAGVEAPKIIDVPPVVIESAPAHGATPAPARSVEAGVREPQPRVRARSLEEMHCSDWRPLLIGAGAVRVCD